MTSAIALTALAAALLLTSAGLVLRLGGTLAFWAGVAALATTGDPWAIPVAALGAAAWLAGHAHFAFRHGAAKGPTAAFLLAGAAALLRRAGQAAGRRRPGRPAAHDGTGAGR
jgi:hypothetical protein